jgi:hypothetical protein
MAADNVILNTGSGGATVRTLSDGTNEWEVATIAYATTVSPGANVLQVVTTAFGLPVAQQGSWTVTANAGTNLNTSLLALEAGGNLASLNTKAPALGQALAAASVPVVMTAIQLAALAPLATQPVSGTFWQATQPVSIAATVGVTQSGTWTNTVTQATAANLNATVVGTGTFAVQVSAALPAGTNVIGHVIVDSGTITTVSTVTVVSAVTAITNALPVGTNSIGTVQPGNTPNTTPWLANQSDPTATTGNITVVDSGTSSTTGQGGQTIITGNPTASSFITVALSGETCVNLQVSGIWTGTLSFERSIDGGTTYYPASMLLHGVSGSALASITANCGLRVNIGGSTNFRVRATATMTGTAAINFRPGFGDAVVGASLEAGTNLLGEVAQGPTIAAAFNGTTTVTPQYATVSTSSSGTTSLVSAVSGKKVYVLRYSISSNGTTNVNLQSHTTTALTTKLNYLTQFASAGGAYCQTAIVATAAGEGLDINNSAAVAISVDLTYVQF